MTQEEIEKIVLGEFEYWRSQPCDNYGICIGAIGAAANIFAAIKGFIPPRPLPDNFQLTPPNPISPNDQTTDQIRNDPPPL